MNLTSDSISPDENVINIKVNSPVIQGDNLHVSLKASVY